MTAPARTPAAIAATVLLLVLTPLHAGAQDTPPTSDASRDSSTSHWLSGVMLAVPTVSGGGAPLGIGFSSVRARPNRIGPDISLAIAPRYLLMGALFGLARVNIAVPIVAGRDLLLLPSAGVSALGGMGSGGATGVQAVNGTLSAIFQSRDESGALSKYAFRVAVSYHRFSGADRFALRVLEFSAMKR